MKSHLLPEWLAFLRYEELVGQSPANVYLAGLMVASHGTFASIVAEHPTLAARRSIFIDLLGSGFSDAPEEFGYSLEDHAATVATLLDELELKDCCLVGYSMGGAVAITLAALRPALVSRLVLMEANLDPLAPGEGMVSTKIAGQTEDEFLSHGFQALMDSFFQMALDGDRSIAASLGIFQVAAPHALYRSAVSLVRATRPTMRENLFRMAIPRVYIFGERSLPDPDWDALASQGIQVLTVPGAGHLMVWDNPDGVAEAISRAITA